jgi:hypothetical protein
MFDTVRAAHEGEERFKFDWPRLTWIMVFQFPVVNAISTLITEVTEVEGTYCNGNFNPKFGYLWATVIQSVTLGVAIAAIWRFYKRMTKRLRARRGLAKLVGFKALVGLIWTQQVLCFLASFCVIVVGKLMRAADHLRHPPRQQSAQAQQEVLLRRSIVRSTECN